MEHERAGLGKRGHFSFARTSAKYIIFQSVNYQSLVARIIFEVFCKLPTEKQFREVRGEVLCYESKYFKQLLWMFVSFPCVFKQAPTKKLHL